jgi:hypothetical protein
VPDLLLAPYLPLADAVRVGPWELLPFRQVGGSTAVPVGLRDPVSRLLDAYSSPTGARTAFGAVAYPYQGTVGAPFASTDLALLSRALLAGTVAENPVMTIDEEDQSPNAGNAVATSENALLYGHPLHGGDFYATSTGMLVHANHIRTANAGQPFPKITPPVELPTPMFASFDDELSTATYTALSAGSTASRRLHRALDWYRIALSNAEAVTVEVRVGAARSALEALTGGGDSTKGLVRAYGVLVREEGTSLQTYEAVFWARGPVQLTSDEWWLTRLCDLRNRIVHGDEIPDSLWEHEGQHQLNHIHDRLISCLKRVVADHAGDAALRLSRVDRMFRRAYSDAEKQLRGGRLAGSSG